MIERHETLRPKEIVAEPNAEMTATPLAVIRAEEMRHIRIDMLHNIRNDIDTALYDRLLTKIEYERALLIALADEESQASAAKKKLDRVLKTEYFTLQRLDHHLF